MRLGLILLGFALPVLLGADTAAPAKPKEFAPQGGGYSIQMPGEPKEQKMTLKTAVGDIETTMHVFVAPTTTSYVVAFNDYPEAAIKNSDPQKVLDGARDGAVRNVKGKLASEKQIKIGDHPGREIVIEVPGQGAMRTRLYIVKARLYQVMVAGTKDTISTKEADNYLASFKLTAK